MSVRLEVVARLPYFIKEVNKQKKLHSALSYYLLGEFQDISLKTRYAQ